MGYVYLIYDQSNDLYKIGVTKEDPSKRMHKLQTGNPTQLCIKTIFKHEYPFRLETMLHNKFKSKQVLNEWFKLSDDDVINFISICEEMKSRINALSDNPFFTKNLR